jgi:hypothetical protein
VQIRISKMVKLYGLGQTLGVPGGYRLQDNRQGHTTTGRIKSIKNSNDSIGYRAFDLPTCSTSPHQTAPARAPIAVSTLSLTESEVLKKSTFPL